MRVSLSREPDVKSVLPTGTIGFVASMLGAFVTLTSLEQWLRYASVVVGLLVGAVTLWDVISTVWRRRR
jgi:uncharacterized membrane protein YfcA